MSRLSIRSKLIGLVGAFLALFGMAIGILLLMASSQSQYGIVIDLAGRQRMLVARMDNAMAEAIAAIETESTVDEPLARLTDLRSQFDGTLAAFDLGGTVHDGGGRAITLAPIRGAPRAALADALEAWRQQDAVMDQLLSGELELFSMAYFDALDRIPVSSQATFEASAALVGALARQSEERGQLLIFVLLASVAAAAVLTVVGIVISRGISRPIRQITGVMKALAAGDLSVSVDAQEGRRDEVGDMARTVHVFKESMIETERLSAEAAKEQAAREARAGRLAGLTGAFDGDVSPLLGALVAAGTRVKATATTLSDTGTQASQQAADVNAASERATDNVNAVASAAEQLTASISEISKQVDNQAQIAKQAVAALDNSNHQVADLDSKARQIGEVVSVITTIAEQTNMLALNATIEAARAGEAGRGFVVVAAEVKNLANETARATEQITEQVAAIQGATGHTVDAIQQIGDSITRMQEISSAVAAAVEQQNMATQEISRNVHHAAEGTEGVTQGIGGVNALARQTGEASDALLRASEQLTEETGALKHFIDRFVGDVRAA